MTIDTEHFRSELLNERERVQAAIANLRDSHPGSLDDEVEEVTGTFDNDHLGETATATLDREIDYTLGENSGQVLAEIDRALSETRQLDNIGRSGDVQSLLFGRMGIAGDF